MAGVVPLSGSGDSEQVAARMQYALTMQRAALLGTRLPTKGLVGASAMIELWTEFLAWEWGLSGQPGETLTGGEL